MHPRLTHSSAFSAPAKAGTCNYARLFRRSFVNSQVARAVVTKRKPRESPAVRIARKAKEDEKKVRISRIAGGFSHLTSEEDAALELDAWRAHSPEFVTGIKMATEGVVQQSDVNRTTIFLLRTLNMFSKASRWSPTIQKDFRVHRDGMGLESS